MPANATENEPMDFYSPIWAVLAMCSMLALAQAPWFGMAGFRTQDARSNAIDGLRGYLALAVVFHHVAVYAHFLADGQWAAPPDRFYAWIGPAGVQVFFMITGFLFWGKVVRSQGHLDIAALIVGRVFRIAPLYVVAVLLAEVLTVIYFGHDMVSPRETLSRLIQSAFAGMLPFSPLSNQAGFMMAGVTWTLQYEWLFYSAIPFLMVAVRLIPRHLMLACAALMGSAVWAVAGRGQVAQIATLFSMGMVAASLATSKAEADTPLWVLSFVCVIAVGTSLLMPGEPYNVERMLLLGVAFLCITRGATVCGLLTCRPAIRLGEISYGIYILQGPVLFLMLSGIRVQDSLPLPSAAAHWLVSIVAVAVLCSLALLAHLVVERPAYAWGRRLASRMAEPAMSRP